MPVLKARVLFSLRLPRLVRLSADGEGQSGRAMMWNGGRLILSYEWVRVPSLGFLLFKT